VFLSRKAVNHSRSRIQALNRSGNVRVNGSAEKDGYRLRKGDRIELASPAPAPAALRGEAIPLVVLYEDAHLIVIEKAAGMVVHPGAGNREGTLVNALLGRFPELAGVGGEDRPGIVHRLDKLTSGLILIARTREAYQNLTRSFQARKVRKEYMALVHGRVRADEGQIELGIGRHPAVRTRMAVLPERGRPAVSVYRVLSRAPRFSMLEVSIRTGRTHQIRVHLAAIGHPVVGDPAYGPRHHPAFVRRYGDPGRYFLHASHLGLAHPVTGSPLEFASPLPEDLVRLRERLGAFGPAPIAVY
jgi:23S rRNA pseudouridine1911/1915/1917 synthase